jgi:hypothetical protein
MGLKLNSQFHIAIRDTHEFKYFQLPLRVIKLAFSMGVYESGFCDMVAKRPSCHVRPELNTHTPHNSLYTFVQKAVVCFVRCLKIPISLTQIFFKSVYFFLQNGSKNDKVQPANGLFSFDCNSSL